MFLHIVNKRNGTLERLCATYCSSGSYSWFENGWSSNTEDIALTDVIVDKDIGWDDYACVIQGRGGANNVALKHGVIACDVDSVKNGTITQSKKKYKKINNTQI